MDRESHHNEVSKAHQTKIQELLDQGANVDKNQIDLILEEFHQAYEITNQIGSSLEVEVDNVKLNPYIAKTLSPSNWCYTIFIDQKTHNTFDPRSLPDNFKGVKIKFEFRQIPRML